MINLLILDAGLGIEICLLFLVFTLIWFISNETFSPLLWLDEQDTMLKMNFSLRAI